MYQQAHKVTLPHEILLQIIDFVIPQTQYLPIALHPSHPTTTTLLSLTRTSRAIYPTARRLLRTYCLYINTEERLEGLIDSDSSHDVNSEISSSPPTTKRYDPTTEGKDAVCLPRSRSSLSLSLSRPTRIVHFTETFSHLSSSIIGLYLRRFVLDYPLHLLDRPEEVWTLPSDSHLSYASLPNLEEFCCAREEIYLGREVVSASSAPIFEERMARMWTSFPRLKTLLLYGIDDQAPGFHQQLYDLRHLETVVLTRPRGFYESEFRREWQALCIKNGEAESRPLEIFLIYVLGESTGQMLSSSDEEEVEHSRVRVGYLYLPVTHLGWEESSQDWIKGWVMSGRPVQEWEMVDDVV